MKDYRYETESFLLRQVKREDAPQLLRCYSDPAAVALMNDDNCIGGFLFKTLDEMEQAIHFWNNDVFQYARPAVIDKGTGETVGTVEEVLHYPAHKLCAVRGGKDEYLVPFVPAFIAGVDLVGGTIDIHMMEGLGSHED